MMQWSMENTSAHIEHTINGIKKNTRFIIILYVLERIDEKRLWDIDH